MNKAATTLVLTAAALAAQAGPLDSAWTQAELNEAFMRGLTKEQCMTKTVASLLAGCEDLECLKTLGGIRGDCNTWAIGNQAEYCATYDQRYTNPLCVLNAISARQCWFLKLGKEVECKGVASGR